MSPGVELEGVHLEPARERRVGRLVAVVEDPPPAKGVDDQRRLDGPPVGDDPDDRLMTKEAFEDSRLVNDLRFVEDGVELLDYLQRRGKYADPASSPRPGLILLDLNMPKKDGREALQEIKADPKLKNIRVVILTTSKAEEDIYRSYDLSAASYITKPVTFAAMAEVVKVLGKYWLEIVALPGEENGGEGGGNG